MKRGVKIFLLNYNFFTLARAGRTRPLRVFCVRVASFAFASFATFAHPARMHAVDAMGEDTTILKKT